MLSRQEQILLSANPLRCKPINFSSTILEVKIFYVYALIGWVIQFNKFLIVRAKRIRQDFAEQKHAFRVFGLLFLTAASRRCA